ncbi:MAG: hypothetical protein MJK13_03495 [Pseudomonadales bacterium]|nr:hypothetical protein [Pseudomonadales bacterium]
MGQVGKSKLPQPTGPGQSHEHSGIALTNNAPHKDNAIALMGYLSSDRAQFIYALQNHEFPVRADTEHSDLFKQYMPEFKSDDISLAAIAQQHGKALELIQRVAFDNCLLESDKGKQHEQTTTAKTDSA